MVLTWDPPRDDTGQVPAGLTGYQLQRCPVAAGQSSCVPQDLPPALVPVTQTSYTDTAVTRGARYLYTVVALCASCPAACKGWREVRWGAVLAKAVGKPVRLQYMREQGTSWDPKGPASTHVARAALDAQGNVIAYEFKSKAFSRVDVDTNGSKLWDTLAGHTLGVPLKSGDNFGVPAESYEFVHKRASWETIPHFSAASRYVRSEKR